MGTFIEIFCSLVTLFVIGSVAGYLVEVIFRRLVSAKRWVNPGFMVGPYLPLYGFGVMTIYVVFFGVEVSIPAEVVPEGWKVVIGILIVGVLMTLIEFIAGLIFIKGLKIKLWDYSNKKGNILGIICPQFSVIWLVAGAAFYGLLFSPFYSMLKGLGENQYYVIIVGIVFGIMIMDFIVSMYYSKQVKQFNHNSDMSYDDLKMTFKKSYNFKEKKNHFYGIIDISSETANTLPEAINEFCKKHPDVDMMSYYSKQENMKGIESNPFAERKDINKKD